MRLGRRRRGDCAANGFLFAAHQVHVPWIIPAMLLIDTFAFCCPAKRYQSAWIGIIVHSVQTLFFAVMLLTLVP